jgi:hypothetical protein
MPLPTDFIHRYSCTVHDGDGCDGHCIPRLADLVTAYAQTVADITEKTPATTHTDFVDQLSTASSRMTDAGINGAEDLETAAIYLADIDEAAEASGIGQAVLLKRARSLLAGLTDMADEYRETA